MKAIAYLIGTLLIYYLISKIPQRIWDRKISIEIGSIFFILQVVVLPMFLIASVIAILDNNGLMDWAK
jgi:hypothetical protein